MEYDIIYDLDDKILLLYDYVYNINSTNCFNIDKINLGKISMNDIKILLIDNNNNNKDEIEFYNKNNKDIFKNKFKLLNNYDIDFIFKRYSDNFTTLVKIKFYKNYDEINSFESKINNDSLFSYILSELILTKKTKHILLPIINIDISCNNIKKFINNEIINQKIKDLINTNQILNICCLQIRESYFQMEVLDTYLNTCNNINYKSLIFQLLHTLAIIQREYEGFRHNNLILKNIYIYKLKESTDYYEYEGFNNDKFYINNIDFDIKITNFDYSIIPKYYGLFNYKNNIDKINAYYDIYIFLNDLLTFINNNNKIIDKDLKKFFDLYLPSKIRNNYNNENLINPIDLLYDIYFNEYRINNNNNNNKNLINNISLNHNYLAGKTIMSETTETVSESITEIKNNYKINTIIESDKISVLGNQTILNNKYNKKSHLNIMFDNKRILKKEKKNDNYLNRKNINITTKIMKGGAGEKQEIMSYRAEKNTPFISNDQKKMQDNRNKENPIREPPVILEQKIYDTSQKPQQKPQFPPTFIPLYDQDGSTMNHLLPYSNVVNQPPLQKVYNISLTNPLGSYSSINKIYEDILPGEQYNYTSISIFERSQLINFLRNNILELHDGEEMTITGGKNSILSYIKILDINPYTINKNPYMDLPRNFLLYRAAYPVRFEQKSNTINIGKPSMGINVRIYMMSFGDINCNKIKFKNGDADNFDLWREIKYYDFIKNEIIKKKISPNFISPILYKIIY